MEIQKLFVSLVMETAQFVAGTKAAAANAVAFGKRVTSIMSNIAMAMAPVGLAVGALGVAFKKSIDTIKEGAAIQTTIQRFDRLSESIGTTADVLLGKLRDATQGMISDTELMNSASMIMSLRLAENEDQVVRLATVVGTLGWDMQQVILTFSNLSYMRLDALGLSVDEIKTKAKELEAQGLSAQEAFKEAVILAGEARLEVGGVSEAEKDLKQLERVLKDVNTQFTLGAAEGFADTLGDIAGSANDAAAGLNLMAFGLGQFLGKLPGWAIGNADALFAMVGLGNLKEIMEMVTVLAVIKGSMEGATFAERELAEMTAAHAKQAAKAAGAIKEQATSTQAMTNRYAAWVRATNERNRAAEEERRALLETGDALETVVTWSLRAEQAASKMGQGFALAKANAEAVAAFSDAFRGVIGDYGKDLPGADKPLVTAARDVKVTTGGLTTDQIELADEYRQRIERLNDQIRDLTNGIGTYGMEQEKVNERIADAQGEIAHYQALLDPLNSVVGETSTVHQDLTVNVGAARQAIYDQLTTMPGAEQAAVLYGMAIGVLSEEEAEAALKAAVLKIKIDELAGRLASGELGVDEALTELDQFIVWLEDDAPDGVQEFIDTVPGMMSNSASKFGQAGEGLGKAIADGIASGINANGNNVTQAVENMALGAIAVAGSNFKIESPSKVFMEMGEALIEGLIVGIEGTEDKLYNKLAEVADKVLRIGMGVWDLQADPLEPLLDSAASATEKAVRELAGWLPEEQIEHLLSMSPAQLTEALRVMRSDWAFSGGSVGAPWLQAAIEAADELNKLTDEQIRQQEELKKLEEQRAKLDFLKYQIDLLNLINDNNLDASILDGLKLGLEANMTDIIAAMTSAVTELVAKTEEELGIHSPSAVYEDIGINMMLGLMMGLERGAAKLEDTLTSALAPALPVGVEIGGRQTTTDNSRRSVNYGGIHYHVQGGRRSSLEQLWEGDL